MSMVLAVLAGRRLDDVARDGAVAVAVLDRWVRDFVVAGADVITGRPDADDAREREGV
ncbi:hypothetical protein [Nocardioides halotolerans]|uniref:hypothetical protein n=1 Tax=Nocardioides halotolerans TaxID=433660 RepID=UPI00040B6C69|nr:hypothetical protein [Nocardioides halotolerans]